MNIDIEDIEIEESDLMLSFGGKVQKIKALTTEGTEARDVALSELCNDIAAEKTPIRRQSMIELVYKELGAKKAVVKSTVNDILDEKKSALKEEGGNIQLPDGVDKDDALEFGIYTYKGRYWAIGKQGKYEISNFTIKVLYHVKTSDVAAYRLIEIKNVYGRVCTINLNTDDFVSLGPFKKVIARFGNFIFKGTDSDLGKLQEKIQREEKATRLVQTLGYNKRGNFYAFANGIVPCGTELAVTAVTPPIGGGVAAVTHSPLGEGRGEVAVTAATHTAATTELTHVTFIPADEYGIIEIDDFVFFIPANSKIFEEKESQFTNDKKFIYTPNTHCNFTTWAKLNFDVYGDKAIIGQLFLISSMFRDIIHPAIGRRFPMLNCSGQRGSGKGTFIESYMWLFGKPQDQIMLGGASTVVGFMRKFAGFCNAIVWLDEYKNSLNPKVIESLKNIYDGIGYERGKKDNTFETDSVPINSACILSGQEMPTAEPALFTRNILLLFKPGKGFTDESRAQFNALKQMQEKTLSHITAHITLHRYQFIQYYKAEFETTFPEIIKRTNSKEIDERMMLNIAVLATTYKVASRFLQFPYTYQQAEKFLIHNMKEQFTILAGSDDVAKWWQIVENLFVMKEIEEGRDFAIENGYLYLRMQQVHPLYLKELRSRNDPHSIDKATLEHYLEMDSSIFVERVRKRFADNSNTWCFKFIYTPLGINLIRADNEDKARAKEAEMAYTVDIKEDTGQAPSATPEKDDDLPF